MLEKKLSSRDVVENCEVGIQGQRRMSSAAKSSMVVGGKLKFKGSKSSSSSKAKRDEMKMPSSVSDQKKEASTVSLSDNGDRKSVLFITEAQRIHKEKRMAVEEKALKKFVKVPHKDRIEMFNLRLSNMTEHNDIPRVSAAGNG